MKVLFLKKFENVWADSPNIDEETLKERLTWENDKLVKVKDSKIKFHDEKPLNSQRTGLRGRGVLGRFGPNHAADPIVTRFNYKTFTLEFIAVLRKDCKKWAIPGGMVDAGEEFSATLQREFTEEVASKCSKEIIDEIFKNGKTIYTGQVYNDPRTTDNAWIETKVVHYHIPYSVSQKLNLTNQEDENYAVKWISCNNKDLYADHSNYIKKVRNNFYKKYYFVFYMFTLASFFYMKYNYFKNYVYKCSMITKISQYTINLVTK